MKAITSLLRNSALSFTLNLVTKAANVVVFILIARQNGPEDAGVFSLATTYLLIFTAITWGLDELMVRQVARDHSSSGRYFGAFLSLRTLLSLVLYGLLALLVGSLLDYRTSTTAPILVMGLSLLPDSLNQVGQSLLASHERFEIPAAAAVVGGLIKVAGAALALYQGAGLLFISWVWVAGGTTAALLVLGAAARLAGRLDPREWVDWSFWKLQLRMGLPFLVIGFLLTLEYQTDVVILSALRTEREVGWYSAATTIAFSLMLIPSAYRAAVYPRMARYHETDREKSGRLYDLSFAYLGAIAIPLAVGLTLLAPRIVELIYGPSFGGTTLPLQIIAWGLIFNFLNVPNSRLMLVDEQQNRLSILLLVSMGLNVALNLALDGTWGVTGAAVARLCSTLAFFFPNYRYVIRAIHPHRWAKALWRPLTAAAVMAAGVWIGQTASLWLLVSGGALVYLAVLLALGGLPGLELARLSWKR